MAFKLAVLKETAAGERRVALDPAMAGRLAQLGAEITLQHDAGANAYFPDSSYIGADIKESIEETVNSAQIVLAVQPPDVKALESCKPGTLLISFVHAHQNPKLLQTLQQQQISCLAMELIPRISRAQSMDALSSQATVAGYTAVLIAAQMAPRLFPMLTTAAGTLRPAKVIIIGAGVAGLQAIATARRLGAQVEAYDIRPNAREQIESLGAKMIDTGINAEGDGGYARELTSAEKQQQADALAKHLKKAHVVISTAALPGRPAPKIITTAMVDAMLPGAVIVDLAAESGGNCELTKPGESYEYKGILINGPLNLASMAATHASEMYSKNVFNLLQLLINEGKLSLNRDDEVIKGCLLTHTGEITHPATAKSLAGDA